MENNRGSWGSNFGFIMAAIGSAVGLGNIWGFPFKMGKSGGFTFLIVYILLAIFVGLVIMASELALGRKTGLGVVGTFQKVSRKFKWVGWLGLAAPFLIMSFYSVLGGYCLQYMSLNMAEVSFNLSGIFGAPLGGSTTFGAMLTNPFGCAVFTAVFMIICMLIVKGGISGGIEKFNKVGMPALFVMLIVIIIRSVTLPNASEGLKFMFVPGYAVEGGFIDEAPGLVSVLATAGGQMFFSLSLAMGVMFTYGSYLDKKENLIKNSSVIVFADTLVALLAGVAVIPAAVANGINNGIPVNEISLGGPKLLFVTLQDVFANMGSIGAVFGIIFYALVVIAAISSAISLMEVCGTFIIDNAAQKGKEVNRTKVTLIISGLIMVEALLVAIDGLGSSGIFTWAAAPAWKDCMLDFMDTWSEGIAMPLGALIMSLMIGLEIKPGIVLDEIGDCASPFFKKFYKFCITIICPIAMAFILAGQLMSFFVDYTAENAAQQETVCYIVSAALLVVFAIIAAVGNKKEAK